MSKRWVTTRRDRASRRYKELHRRLALEVAAMREEEPARLIWWLYG